MLLGLLLLGGVCMAAWSINSAPTELASGQRARPFESYKQVELLQLKDAYEAAARESEARFRRYEAVQPQTARAEDLAGRVEAFQVQARRSAERKRLQAEWASDTARLSEIDRELGLRANPIDRWMLAARGMLH